MLDETSAGRSRAGFLDAVSNRERSGNRASIPDSPQEPSFPRGKQGRRTPKADRSPRAAVAGTRWAGPYPFPKSVAPRSLRGRARRRRNPGLRRRTVARPGAVDARGKTPGASADSPRCPRTRVIAVFEVSAATISIRPLQRAHSRTSRRNTRQIHARDDATAPAAAARDEILEQLAETWDPDPGGGDREAVGARGVPPVRNRVEQHVRPSHG
jgi:hypothetical protein